jgi:hypothetical protein
MFDYRIDRFGPEGHLEGGDAFVAASDEEAQGRAKLAANGRDYELWCGRRLVATGGRTANETPPCV